MYISMSPSLVCIVIVSQACFDKGYAFLWTWEKIKMAGGNSELIRMEFFANWI